LIIIFTSLIDISSENQNKIIFFCSISFFVQLIFFTYLLNKSQSEGELILVKDNANKINQLKLELDKVKADSEKNKTLLESIQDAIVAIDPYNNILFFNQSFNRLFSPSRAVITDKMKFWKIFSPEIIHQTFKQVIENKQAKQIKSIELKTNQGEIIFKLSIYPMINDKDEITGALAIFNDVTETILTEKMRVDFVANVSHEVRTPLTSIKGFTQLLESELPKNNPLYHDFIHKIIFNTDRLMELFNDLLNLSVIESKKDIQPESIELVELINSLRPNFEVKYPNKKIEWQTDFNSTSLKADKKLLEQVINNIIDNAIKYHPRQQVKLKIKQAVVTVNDQNMQVISISDDGAGIAKEHLPRLFERFYRVDSARSTERGLEGTGIGLSLVKHIMAKHQGSVTVESELNQGSCFKLYFPGLK
jgi:two-component system phosphate regulon sensor histidine kinase PhoR